MNLNGFPEQKQTADYPHTDLLDYTMANPKSAPFTLYVDVDNNQHYLQERIPDSGNGSICACIESKAFMPFVGIPLTDSFGNISFVYKKAILK